MRPVSRAVAACLVAALAAPCPVPAQSSSPATPTAGKDHRPSRTTNRRHAVSRKAAAAAPLTPLNSHDRALQLLDRFTYGARPGEVEQVVAMGEDAWLERQLQPASLQDSALERRLAAYPTLTLSAAEAIQLMPDGGVLRQIEAGRREMPADPELRAVYEVELLKYQRREERRKAQAAATTAGIPAAVTGDADRTPAATAMGKTPGGKAPNLAAPATNAPSTVAPGTAAAAANSQDDDLTTDRAGARETASRLAANLLALPPAARLPALLKLPVSDRALCATFVAGDQRSALLAGFTPHERELFNLMSGGPGATGQLIQELSEAKLLRDVLSERQLAEVMTDFWFNHFNVYAGKESDRWYTPSYERDVIRPHALGHFRDLLVATAESPAMQVYLDNWQSIGPDSPTAERGPARGPKGKKPRGLNENYGRELMELHTLSVDGGYTQADVTALASIFTGWGVDRPQAGGGFQFDPRRHEPGDKHWLGQTIAAGQAPDGSADGQREGLEALNILARSPKTAHFISYLLVQRFVAEQPPAALVDRLTETYLTTDGDIAAMLRALVHSPEFNARQNFRTEVKTPVEFLASSFRTTGTDPANPAAMVSTLRQMGMPLYGAQPPTGYVLTADHWMNSAAIVDRLAFADAFTSGHYGGDRFDGPHLLAESLLAGGGFDGPQSVVAGTAARSTGEQPGGLHAVANIDPARERAAPEPTVTWLRGATDGGAVAIAALEHTLLGIPPAPPTEALLRREMERLTTPSTAPADSLATLTRLLLSSPEFQLR